MKIIAIILGILCSPHLFAVGDSWSVYFSESDWATVSDSPQGEYSLSDAIAHIPKEVWLRSFRIFPEKDDIELQKELHDFLELKYPGLHKEALASAGNMHNPKVVVLREAFEEALMASSMVKRINVLLQSRCERITSASFEKFTIRKNKGQPTYNAMVWLSTEKCT